MVDFGKKLKQKFFRTREGLVGIVDAMRWVSRPREGCLHALYASRRLIYIKR